MVRIPALVAVLFLAGLAVHAQTAQPAERHDSLDGKSPLMKLASELGRIAGNAEFCEFEEKDIEFFIASAEARLAEVAEDQVLLAGSKIEFNSHAAFGRAEGPEEGCNAFKQRFAFHRSRL